MLQQPMQPRPGLPNARSGHPAAGVDPASHVADSVRLVAGRDFGGGGGVTDALPLPAPYSNIYPHHKDDGCHYVCYSPSTQPGDGRPNHQPVYTADQIREYAKQAVEAERNHWYDEVQYRFGFEVADEIRARGDK